jgi:A/G-specific adenine glycosylase
MMLQQTQVDTVIDYFNRFVHRFPTVLDLANADLQQVLKLWEGLGYYARARYLHAAAQQLMINFKGELPSDYHTLQTLPGIGPYAAAAIASIAFEQPIPVVDGNVLRVCTRYWGIQDDIRLPKVRNELFHRLSPEILLAKPSDFNQALMELGALVCKPQNPRCDGCPLSLHCVACRQKKTSEIPYKSKSLPIPHYSIGVAVIKKNNLILIGKRKETGMLGGLWEFPGGKQKENEDITQTVKREVYEETNLNIQVGAHIVAINHAYTHFKITLHAFYCNILSGKEKPLSAEVLKWVSLNELADYPFPKANIKLIQYLKAGDIKK